MNPDLLPFLPPDVAYLVDAIGAEAAISLASHYAGQSLYVPLPESITDTHPLVQAIGLPSAMKLAQIYQGEYIQFPVCHRLRAEIRHREVIAKRKTGVSINRIARETNLHRRTVALILAKAKRQEGKA